MRKTAVVIISVLTLAIASIGCGIDTEAVMEVRGVANALPFPSEDTDETAILWQDRQQFCDETDTWDYSFSQQFILPNASKLNLPAAGWRNEYFEKDIYVKFRVKGVRGEFKNPIIEVLEIRID